MKDLNSIETKEEFAYSPHTQNISKLQLNLFEKRGLVFLQDIIN